MPCSYKPLKMTYCSCKIVSILQLPLQTSFVTFVLSGMSSFYILLPRSPPLPWSLVFFLFFSPYVCSYLCRRSTTFVIHHKHSWISSSLWLIHTFSMYLPLVLVLGWSSDICSLQNTTKNKWIYAIHIMCWMELKCPQQI